MLIDGAHSEEIRVVITEGTKLLDYDIESSTKTQNKGNIYLAKVMRVEPSLQAAFVDYGGNRHGFLAFNEIHPDYYQIPVEDREALKEHVAEFEEAAIAAKEHLEDIDGDGELVLDDGVEIDTEKSPEAESEQANEQTEVTDPTGSSNTENSHEEVLPTTFSSKTIAGDDPGKEDNNATSRKGNRFIPRRYKIQEVIKRNQIILIQVVKEERGNKGAALSTFISLPGHYLVLMPNNPEAGGISKSIEGKARDDIRDKLKQLDSPKEMGLIVRTAGEGVSLEELKWDLDYLLNLWEAILEANQLKKGPFLIFRENDLISRSLMFFILSVLSIKFSLLFKSSLSIASHSLSQLL